jgi:hypothetical protein
MCVCVCVRDACGRVCATYLDLRCHSLASAFEHQQHARFELVPHPPSLPPSGYLSPSHAPASSSLPPSSSSRSSSSWLALLEREDLRSFGGMFELARFEFKIPDCDTKMEETLGFPMGHPTPTTDQHSSHGTLWGTSGLGTIFSTRHNRTNSRGGRQNNTRGSDYRHTVLRQIAVNVVLCCVMLRRPLPARRARAALWLEERVEDASRAREAGRLLPACCASAAAAREGACCSAQCRVGSLLLLLLR